MSDNNEDADYWEIYDRGYNQALIDAEQNYYTSEEYSDSDSSEESETDSDSSPPRPPSPPPRPPSPRRQTVDKYEDEDKPKYKYKYKYKHNKDKHDDKDKPNDVKYDKDKPSDVKVNCVTYDPYYTDDSESEDELEELHPSQRGAII